MRSVISLLGGMAVSAAGLLLVVGSSQDAVGVLLIGAGALVAVLGRRAVHGGAQPK